MNYFSKCSECKYLDEKNVIETMFFGIRHYCNWHYEYVHADNACDDFYRDWDRSSDTVYELNEESRTGKRINENKNLGMVRGKNESIEDYSRRMSVENIYALQREAGITPYVPNTYNDINIDYKALSNRNRKGFLKKFSPYFYTFFYVFGMKKDPIYLKLDKFRSNIVPIYPSCYDIHNYDKEHGRNLHLKIVNSIKNDNDLYYNSILMLVREFSGIDWNDIEGMHDAWVDGIDYLEQKVDYVTKPKVRIRK